MRLLLNVKLKHGAVQKKQALVDNNFDHLHRCVKNKKMRIDPSMRHGTVFAKPTPVRTCLSPCILRKRASSASKEGRTDCSGRAYRLARLREKYCEMGALNNEKVGAR